ncbi:branched-chain amino acid ABC transporter permease [Thalassospira mesophila]|uniref:branched-chain amino acid ABC transporter permease n=1 Tax=Thalassospira mesophila TaxID=1293891 RepID=UPI000A1D94C2|nr:branched-chain amino acid ABC transporter permease [Thalassospira mesophila]
MGRGWSIRGWHILLGLLLPLLLAGCEKQDFYKFNICRLALPGVENSGLRFHLLTAPDINPSADTITLIYQILPDSVPYFGDNDGAISDNLPLAGEGPPAFAHSITCQFAPAKTPGLRVPLIGITTSRFGPLPDSQLALLDRFWINRVGPSALAFFDDASRTATLPNVADIGHDAAFAAQLTLSGLSRGAVYALLALPFTLIYGLIGRINLAFGEMLMVGAVAAMVASLAVYGGIGWHITFIVICAVLAAMAYGAGLGLLSWRWVFGPLGRGRANGQAMIVASLGCALVIQEFVRIAWSARNFNLPPIWQFNVPLVRGGSFIVTLDGFDILALLLAGATCIILQGLMHKTAFGRAWHAISQDRFAAALCGVRLHKVEAQTFALAGMLCGIAGAILALRYGVINFHSGTLFGFKALTAAVLGGIGMVRGAWLGGILLGLLESLWTGYFGDPYRDAAVFGLLALVLILKPEGLLGVNSKNDSLLAARTS